MKIAILSFYSGRVSRGVETFVQEVSTRLSNSQQVTVYQAGPIDVKHNYDVVQVPMNIKWGNETTCRLLRYLFVDYYSWKIKQFTQKALSILRKDPPDVLIALNNGWQSLLGKRFCNQHKTKLVLASFSGLGWDDKVNVRLNPDVFICCTSYHQQWAKEINSLVKTKVIPIGVPINRFKPEGEKFPVKLKHPIILSVAGPQKSKRIDLAIKAISLVPQASLLMVGRQPKRINQLGKQMLGNRYQEVEVGYQDIDMVYRSVDAFTLPSEPIEAYGISILEALATNLPVVVTDDPIRKELVGEAGILVDPTDIEKYAQAIRTVLTKKFADQPRQQALKFSWDKVAKQYLQLCLSLKS